MAGAKKWSWTYPHPHEVANNPKLRGSVERKWHELDTNRRTAIFHQIHMLEEALAQIDIDADNRLAEIDRETIRIKERESQAEADRQQAEADRQFAMVMFTKSRDPMPMTKEELAHLRRYGLSVENE